MKKIKKVVFAVCAAMVLFSCGTEEPKVQEKVEEKVSFFGSKFDPKGAISPEELMLKMKDGVEEEVILKTTINGTCAKKGCWMTVEMPNDEEMMISMIDYSFFVPKVAAEGLVTYIKGSVQQDTTTVAELRHYAEDANKSEAEIAAITEPQYGLSMTATGIAILGYEAPAEHSHEGHDHGDHEGHNHGDHEGHDHGDHEGHDHGDHEGHDHGDHEGHDHGDHEGHSH